MSNAKAEAWSQIKEAGTRQAVLDSKTLVEILYVRSNGQMELNVFNADGMLVDQELATIDRLTFGWPEDAPKAWGGIQITR